MYFKKGHLKALPFATHGEYTDYIFQCNNFIKFFGTPCFCAQRDNNCKRQHLWKMTFYRSRSKMSFLLGNAVSPHLVPYIGLFEKSFVS